MVERTCIVTRTVHAPEDLIRFVVGPDNTVVPDLKGNLPGRGVWVGMKRALVQQAVDKKAFARGFKMQVTVPQNLADQVDELLCNQALGALGFARKAGECIIGSGKVDASLRNGKSIAVLHASDGAEDGLRKLSQSMFSSESADGRALKIWRVFNSAQMNLALGATNVIHASIMNGGAGRNCILRVVKLSEYRDMEPVT